MRTVPDIALTIPHALPPEEAVARLRKLLDDLQAKSPYLESATVSWESGTTGHLAGEGFVGTLAVLPSAVEARIRLDGLMAMFRPMVEEKLRELIAGAVA
jgi:hypothetical protein